MSKQNIVLGSVSVPLAAYATQANAILGIKGSGKTTTAKGIAEQLLDHDIPILVLDPVGMWRYLKVPKEKGGKAYNGNHRLQTIFPRHLPATARRPDADRDRPRHRARQQNPFRRMNRHKPGPLPAFRFPYRQEMYPEAVARFWSYVIKNKANECWGWRAAIDAYGYGAFSVDNRMTKAHRFSYWVHLGPLPERLCVCHRCDNPACCNPDHLFLGTQSENCADQYRKGHYYYGATHQWAKLTEDKVRLIRDSTVPAKILAPQFGVSRRNINMIRARASWKHVT